MNKKLFLFVAATAALASCSDDLQFEANREAATDGLKGKLVPAGLLGGVRATNDATRAYSPKGSFVWMAEHVGDGTLTVGDLFGVDPLDPEYDATVTTAGKVYGDYPQVGLCWTGVDPGYSELTAAGENVFTNYLYEQKGWIKKGDLALELDECNGTVYNGAFYIGSGLTPAADFNGKAVGTASVVTYYSSVTDYNTDKGTSLTASEFAALPAWMKVKTGKQSTRWNSYYYTDASRKVEGRFTQGTTPNVPLNLGNGIFTTENSSVFQGEYIVYFPYNPTFKKGPIVANVGDHYSVNVADDVYATISANAFQLGLLPHYEGIKAKDNQQAEFTTENYSSVALVELFQTAAAVKKVKSVVLYSAKQGIVYQAGVKANSVVNAVKSEDITKVEQVDGTQKHVHAVFADLSDSDKGTDYVEVKQSTNYSQNSAVQVALPVLPQTVAELQLIVVYDDFTTASKTLGNVEFKAGGFTELPVDLKSVAAGNYIAYNEPSLVAVLEKIKTTGGTVELLRPIDLEKENISKYVVNDGVDAATINYGANITLNASAACENAVKCESAYITVKSNTKRTIESTLASATFTVNVPVIVEGYGCCAPHAGVLNLGGTNASAVDKIKFTKTLTNYGTTNVGNTTGRSEVVLVDVKNIRDTEYVKSQISKNGKTYTKGSFDRKDILALTVPVVPEAAKLNFLAPAAPAGQLQQKTVAGNITNEGSVVFSAAGTFADGNSDGNRANFVTVESITNKGFLTVGKSKAVTETDLAGGDVVVKAFALVHVNKNIVNNEKYAYIHTEVETPGTAHSATTDGRLDIYNAGSTSSNSGTIENHGVINLLGATHLQNQEKGLFIDRVNGQVGGLYVENGTALNAAATDADYNEIYYRGIEAAAGKYSTDVKPGIYCTEVNTPARLAKVLKDPVQQKSCVVIDIIDNPSVGNPETYDFAVNTELKALSAANLNVLKDKDVRFSNPTVIKNSHKSTSPAKYDKTTEIGHCIDVKANVTLDEGNAYNVYNNVLVREGAVLDMTANAAQLNVGDAANTVKGKNVYVFGNGKVLTVPAVGPFVSTPRLYVGHDLVVKAAAGIVDLGDGAKTTTNNRDLYVENDVKNTGKVYSDKYFYIGNDYVGAAGSNLDSDGNDNIVKHNFELSGDAQFAPNTTTTIEDTFNSNAKASVFTREELGGDPDSRSTVNCYTLGKTEGHAVGGWPTQYGDM